MSYTTLHNLKQLTSAYSGNDDPGVFIQPDITDNSKKYGFSPTCVFIDDDGDIIIQFDVKKVMNVLVDLIEDLNG